MVSEIELRTRASLLAAVRDPHDDAAWAAFKKLYEGPIYNWAVNKGLPPHDAEEMTQDVLVKLLDEMPRFEYDPTKRFRSWLRRVVSTAVINRYRERKRRPGDWATGDTTTQEALREWADPSGNSFDEMAEVLEDRLEQSRLLSEALQNVRTRIDAQTWGIFTLLLIDGVKATEVAARIGINITAVYAAKSRVLKMIRTWVGGAHKEPD